jgi:hypothetical protein
MGRQALKLDKSALQFPFRTRKLNPSAPRVRLRRDAEQGLGRQGHRGAQRQGPQGPDHDGQRSPSAHGQAEDRRRFRRRQAVLKPAPSGFRTQGRMPGQGIPPFFIWRGTNQAQWTHFGIFLPPLATPVLSPNLRFPSPSSAIMSPTPGRPDNSLNTAQDDCQPSSSAACRGRWRVRPLPSRGIADLCKGRRLPECPLRTADNLRAERTSAD